MIEGTNPNGQVPATTNDEQTIPAGLNQAAPQSQLLHVSLLVLTCFFYFPSPEYVNMIKPLCRKLLCMYRSRSVTHNFLRVKQNAKIDKQVKISSNFHIAHLRHHSFKRLGSSSGCSLEYSTSSVLVRKRPVLCRGRFLA